MAVPVVEPRRLFPTDHVNIHICMSQAGLVGYDNPSLILRSLIQIMSVKVGSNLGVAHSSSCFFRDVTLCCVYCVVISTMLSIGYCRCLLYDTSVCVLLLYCVDDPARSVSYLHYIRPFSCCLNLKWNMQVICTTTFIL